MRAATRSVLATLGATAVAGPLGVVIQQALSFQILWLGDDPGLALGLAYAGIIVGIAMLTQLIAGAPVEWAVRRLAPRARESRRAVLATLLSAALAVALFSLNVSWGLRPYEAGLLLALTLVFFATRRTLLGLWAGRPLGAPGEPGLPSG